MLKLSGRDKTAIIGALAFHVVLLGTAYMLEIQQHAPVTFQVLVDAETLDETPEEELARLKSELDQELERLYDQVQEREIRNVAISHRDEQPTRATEFKQSMTAEEYEREIVRNALSQQEFEKMVENRPTMPDDEPSLPAPAPQAKREKPQKAAYRGPATVVFYLDGRQSDYLDIPVYTCEGAAIVTVNITVNAQGSVTKASIDKSSEGTNDCYRNAALASARGALFSTSAQKSQSGRIVYNFVPQR